MLLNIYIIYFCIVGVGWEEKEESLKCCGNLCR